MKMGILSPDSAYYPNIGHQFTTALIKSGPGVDIEWIVESVGNGSDLNRVKSLMEQMIQVEKVDILVLFLEFGVVEKLKLWMQDYSKLFIVVNTGANYPKDWTPVCNIVFLHLNQAFCCRLTGNSAGAMFREAILATNEYDEGYLQTEAIATAFERQDGKVVQRFVSKAAPKAPPNKAEVLAVFSFITKPTAILLMTDYEPGLALLKIMQKLPNAEYLSIFASPMLLNGGQMPIPENGWPFSITGYTPWHSMNEASRYQLFDSSIIDNTSEKQDIFSLLGWETGMLLHEWFAVSGRKPATWDAAKLTGVALSSPRGMLSFDPVNHHFSAPVNRLHLAKNSHDWEVDAGIDFDQEWAIFSRYFHPVNLMEASDTTYPCY